MDDRELIRTTLKALSRRLRLVRALAAGTRFLAVGLALAVVPLLLKGLFPGVAALAAAGIALGAGVAGVLYGLLARLSASHAARLADRRLTLKERLTSAEEHLTPDAERAGPTDDVVRAQLAETAARVRDLRPATAFPFTIPTQGRWLAPAAALVVTLALLPPVPLKLPAVGTEPKPQEAAPEQEEPREKPVEQKLTPPGLPTEVFKKAEERDVQRGPLAAHDQPGDINATFRDTPMSQQRPDFRSFIKQADERLKMMARPEGLPDLSRDVTQSPYQMMIRRMQEQVQAGKLQGLSWDQIQQLLSQMGQTGQRTGGSGLPDDLMEQLQGQGGSPDKMLEALSRALNRLRDRDEAAQGKGGKGLREGPSRQADASQGKDGQGKDGQGKEGQDPGTGGSLPGTEPSLQTRGEATARVGGEKQDSMLEGDLREGQMEAYDTNMTGQGADAPSRLPYMEVFSQYRKQMEEALAKEPIPFSYREQVKEYFRILESR
jgi:hypothetical protein